MVQDILPAGALPSHVIRAILTHAHAMSIALHMEGEIIVFIFLILEFVKNYIKKI